MTKIDDYTTKLFPITLICISIIIGILLFAIYNNNRSTEEQINEIKTKGIEQEKLHLLEVQNAKTCEEKMLLIVKYSGSFWVKETYDAMFKNYEESCIPDPNAHLGGKVE